MAQFKKGDIVWYADGEKADNLAVITEVTSANPAQYHVTLTHDNSTTVCGEGENEPGAVRAL